MACRTIARFRRARVRTTNQRSGAAPVKGGYVASWANSSRLPLTRACQFAAQANCSLFFRGKAAVFQHRTVSAHRGHAADGVRDSSNSAITFRISLILLLNPAACSGQPASPWSVFAHHGWCLAFTAEHVEFTGAATTSRSPKAETTSRPRFGKGFFRSFSRMGTVGIRSVFGS